MVRAYFFGTSAPDPEEYQFWWNLTSDTLYVSVDNGDDPLFWEVVSSGGGGPVPYDIITYYPGTPIQSEKLVQFKSPRSFTIPSDQSNGSAIADVAPAGSVTFQIRKNGSSIGTAVFDTANTTGTLTIGSTANFAVGDIFSITYESTDEDISGISMGIVAIAD